MQRVEEELLALVAARQPEIARQLVARLLRLPAPRLQALLASPEALVKAVDGALAEEMCEQELTADAPAWETMAGVPLASPARGLAQRLAQAPQAPQAPHRIRAQGRPQPEAVVPLAPSSASAAPEAPSVAGDWEGGWEVNGWEVSSSWDTTDASPSGDAIGASKAELLARVAALQPELAPMLVESLLVLGHSVVDECLDSKRALRRRVDAALAALFQVEAVRSAAESEVDPTKAAASTRRFFREGSGHGLSSTPAMDPPSRAASWLASGLARGRARDRPAAAPPASPLAATLSASVSSAAALPAAAPLAAALLSAAPLAAAPSVSLPVAPLALAPATTMMSGTRRSRVWGLEEYLADLSLSAYLEPTAAWAAEMGAAYLEELAENWKALADALALRPLERRRLERQGLPAAQRLALLRPDPAVSAVPGAPGGPGAPAATAEVATRPGLHGYGGAPLEAALSIGAVPHPVAVPLPGLWR